jgi:ABC-type nitrate/sulfonate/bicarbonate transport system permease component
MSRTRKALLYAAIELVTTCVILAVIWIYLAEKSSLTFPTGSSIVKAFSDNWLFSKVGSDVLPSLYRVGAGFVLAVILAVPVGIAIGSSRVVHLLFSPVLHFLRSVPAVALLPLFVVLVGTGSYMKIVYIAFGSWWPILLNTADGVEQISPARLDSARAFQIRGGRLLWFVTLPAVLPRIFAGMRAALSLSFVLMVAAEMVASRNGIGFFLVSSADSFAIADMWSAVLLIGGLSYLANTCLGLLERRFLRWYLEEKGLQPW